LVQRHVFDETLPNFIKTKHIREGENRTKEGESMVKDTKKVVEKYQVKKKANFHKNTRKNIQI
jgi:hypothetical protein